MSFISAAPSGQKVRISFETNLEVAKCLKDLVKYYKIPLAKVLEVLICLEHESLDIKDEPHNDYVQEPRKVKW